MAYNLESVVKSLHQILHPDPRHHPWNLDSEQKPLVHSLLEKVSFLKQVFANSTVRLTGDVLEALERRITDAAHHAEDVIDSHLRNRIRNRFVMEEVNTHLEELKFLKHRLCDLVDLLLSDLIVVLFPNPMASELFIDHRILIGLIREFSFIKNEISRGTSSSTRALNPMNIVVPIYKDLRKLKNLRGVSGVRRMTRTQNLSNDHLTLSGFNSREWISISQEYDMERALLDYSKCTLRNRMDVLSQEHDELIFRVYQTLLARRSFKSMANVGSPRHQMRFDRRSSRNVNNVESPSHQMKFPIELKTRNLGKDTCPLNLLEVMQEVKLNFILFLAKQVVGDILSTQLPRTQEPWEQVARDVLIQEYNDESMPNSIYQTLYARRSFKSVANGESHEVETWNLLRTKVFGGDACPPKLEEIGRLIAQHCEGLPLVAHVVGDILTLLPSTQEAWEQLARDVSSVMANTNDQFGNILALTCNHLPGQVKPLVKSLQEKVSLLKQLFENSTRRIVDGVQGLEQRTIHAAHDDEDVIESDLNPNKNKLVINPPDLRRVIQEFELIEEEITKVMGRTPIIASVSSSLHISSTIDMNPKNIVVGINEDLMKLKDRLTGHQSNLETISIVGMGGIGKTTLAQNLYNDQSVVSHFYIRAWITISQEYSRRKILLGLSRYILVESPDLLSQISNEDLALNLYQTLCGRTYLIVLDDMWNPQAWDDLKMVFPNNQNGSHVIVTTRELSVANYVGSFHHQMNFLNEFESWKLLHTKIFGEKKCPQKLEKVGRVIARDCKGLPLATHVVSGILTQLTQTQEAWEEVARDVSSVVTNTNNEQFANILALSYYHLPSHLKPCFLYMAVFPEDYEIRVSKLVKLWVAEGFLKPIPHESIEGAAKVYLKDLVDRNLILVHRHETKEHIKSYVMHDLMRELCIRKAEEENFLYINTSKVHVQPKRLPMLRRICEHGINEDSIIPVKATKLSRSILVFNHNKLEWTEIWKLRLLQGLQLLQVLDVVEIGFSEFPEEILKLINLRYLALTFKSMRPLFPLSMLQNLQTICFRRVWWGDPWTFSEAARLLTIPKLRHLKFEHKCLEFYLEPGQSFPLQEDLQSLSGVIINDSLQKLVEVAPNLKKLGVCDEGKLSCFVDLTCLSKLETLRLWSKDRGCALLSSVICAPSLIKLIVNNCTIMEEHMDKIGMLPNLQVLKLDSCNFQGGEWMPIEEGFQSLTYLLLKNVELVNWIADESHYPRLQQLVIEDCPWLEEIPVEIGGILTLETIDLKGRCSPSALESAKKILYEQHEELGNYALEVVTTGSYAVIRDVKRLDIEAGKSAWVFSLLERELKTLGTEARESAWMWLRYETDRLLARQFRYGQEKIKSGNMRRWTTKGQVRRLFGPKQHVAKVVRNRLIIQQP